MLECFIIVLAILSSMIVFLVVSVGFLINSINFIKFISYILNEEVMDEKIVEAIYILCIKMYHKGQRVIYKGEDSEVKNFSFLLSIRRVDRCQVVCGNIYSEVFPYYNQNCTSQNTLENKPNSDAKQGIF